MVDLKTRLGDADLFEAPDLWNSIQEHLLSSQLDVHEVGRSKPPRRTWGRTALAVAATLVITVAIVALVSRVLRPTTLPANHSTPSVFAPFHGMIVYLARTPTEQYPDQLTAIDPATAARSLVPTHAIAQPLAWSSDGDSLLLSDGEVISSDGSVTHLLSTKHQIDGSFSPDGNEIAYNSKGTIYIADATGEGSRRVLVRGVSGAYWSPDGSRIAFVTTEPRGRLGLIETVKPDGSGRQIVLPLSRFGLNNPDPLAWSPDGSRIAFSASHGCCQDRFYRIGIVKLDGSGARLLTAEDGSAYPTWAPDGSRIAFLRAGTLYTMSPQGKDVRPIANDVTPFISPFRLTWNPVQPN